MSAEWVVAVGTIRTFIVIAASATAALVQMRHMRSANQISLFTSYNAEFDSPQFASAFAFVKTLRRMPVDDSLSLQYEATKIGTRTPEMERKL